MLVARTLGINKIEINPYSYKAVTANGSNEFFGPGTKVIFSSGYTAENTLLKSAIQKGTTILQKPFSMSRLSRAIRDVLARGISEE